MINYEYVRVEREGTLAILWLNRPPVNVLNIAMMDEMICALNEIAADKQIRLLLLRGEGRCFSAGMDVGDHLPDKVRAMFQKMHALLVTINELDIPTISIIHGTAFGGGLEVAVMTDFTYAVSGAKIGQPEIKLGVFPPLAVAYFPQLIGARNAYDLILTGRTIQPEEALRMGLINGVFPNEELETRIREIASTLLQQSGAALSITKRALRSSVSSVFDRLSAAEEIYLEQLMHTEDALEGLQAFLQKRDPQWRHR